MGLWVRLLEYGPGNAMLLEASPGRTERETVWRCLVTGGEGRLAAFEGLCTHAGSGPRDDEVARSAISRTAGTDWPGAIDPGTARLVSELLYPAGEPDPALDREQAERSRAGFLEAWERVPEPERTEAKPRRGISFIEIGLMVAIAGVASMAMAVAYEGATHVPDHRPRLIRDLAGYAALPLESCKVRDVFRADDAVETLPCRGSGRVRVLRAGDAIEVALEDGSGTAVVGLRVGRDGAIEARGDLCAQTLDAQTLDALRQDTIGGRARAGGEPAATQVDWAEAYDGVAATLAR